MSQCDMGRKVMASEEDWEKIWFTISRLHWEAQLEGLADCMKHFVHPEAFKYTWKKSYGGYLTLSVIPLIAMLLLLL